LIQARSEPGKETHRRPANTTSVPILDYSLSCREGDYGSQKGGNRPELSPEMQARGTAVDEHERVNSNRHRRSTGTHSREGRRGNYTDLRGWRVVFSSKQGKVEQKNISQKKKNGGGGNISVS